MAPKNTTEEVAAEVNKTADFIMVFDPEAAQMLREATEGLTGMTRNPDEVIAASGRINLVFLMDQAHALLRGLVQQN